MACGGASSTEEGENPAALSVEVGTLTVGDLFGARLISVGGTRSYGLEMHRHTPAQCTKYAKIRIYSEGRTLHTTLDPNVSTTFTIPEGVDSFSGFVEMNIPADDTNGQTWCAKNAMRFTVLYFYS